MWTDTCEPLVDTRPLVSRRTNEGLTATVLCGRCSVLPHHQYDYQLDTVVSHQYPPAVNGHDNCISMRRSHRTLSRFSFCFPHTHTHTHTPPPPTPPYTARSKSSSYWTSVIVSPPDLSDILCLPSLPLPVLPEGPTWPQAACSAACLVITQTVNPRVTEKTPSAKSSASDKNTSDLKKTNLIFPLWFRKEKKNQKLGIQTDELPFRVMIMLSHDVKELNLLLHIHRVLLQNKSSTFPFCSLWTRQWGEITNTNETKSPLYFYQMCGRYANDTVTVSDTNVSSCVCRCNKTSVGFLPTRQANLSSSGKLSVCVSADASQRFEKNKAFKARCWSSATHFFKIFYSWTGLTVNAGQLYWLLK